MIFIPSYSVGIWKSASIRVFWEHNFFTPNFLRQYFFTPKIFLRQITILRQNVSTPKINLNKIGRKKIILAEKNVFGVKW